MLYVSPLKALAVDVERNLRSPLVGIEREAARLGLELVVLADLTPEACKALARAVTREDDPETSINIEHSCPERSILRPVWGPSSRASPPGQGPGPGCHPGRRPRN